MSNSMNFILFQFSFLLLVDRFYLCIVLRIFGIFCALQVEAGDVIVRVNGTDVHQFTTKEGMIHYSFVLFFSFLHFFFVCACFAR